MRRTRPPVLRQSPAARTELLSVSAARAELAAFRARGGEAVVQWTPYGLGRRAADLPPLSREAGVHVVAATAAARSVDGGPGMPYLLRRVRPRRALAVGEELAARIFTENPGRAFGVEWR